MAEFIKFSEHLISSDFIYAYGISAVDLTGNGLLDIVAADTDKGLYWFENDGKGDFTRHVVHLRKGEWIERHTWADVNGDGRPEFVGIDNWGGAVHYFEIKGDPRDSDSWVQHYINPLGELPGAYDVTVADFDGDGDLDVAASSWRKGNRFAWYENRNGQWVTHIIEDNIGETRTVVAVDMDGDGKVDLLGSASAGSQVMWYENPGDPATQSWEKHIIDTVPRPIHGHPVDMDGDGDVDVIMATGHGSEASLPYPNYGQVVWYENQGKPGKGPWQKHVISDSFPQGFEAVAVDLDGDEQVEVIATAFGPGGRIVLFKHRGDPRGPWDIQTLRDPWINADTVIIADIDNDGRLDIVAAAERGSNEVRWWRNEGPV